MIFHENRLLAAGCIPYFVENLENVAKFVVSAAVVIGALKCLLLPFSILLESEINILKANSNFTL